MNGIDGKPLRFTDEQRAAIDDSVQYAILQAKKTAAEGDCMYINAARRLLSRADDETVKVFIEGLMRRMEEVDRALAVSVLMAGVQRGRTAVVDPLAGKNRKEREDIRAVADLLDRVRSTVRYGHQPVGLKVSKWFPSDLPAEGSHEGKVYKLDGPDSVKRLEDWLAEAMKPKL